MVSRLAKKIREGAATADEAFEYEVCAALESASMPRPVACRSIFDLPVARYMWTADARDMRS